MHEIVRSQALKSKKLPTVGGKNTHPPPPLAHFARSGLVPSLPRLPPPPPPSWRGMPGTPLGGGTRGAMPPPPRWLESNKEEKEKVENWSTQRFYMYALPIRCEYSVPFRVQKVQAFSLDIFPFPPLGPSSRFAMHPPPPLGPPPCTLWKIMARYARFTVCIAFQNVGIRESVNFRLFLPRVYGPSMIILDWIPIQVCTRPGVPVFIGLYS